MFLRTLNITATSDVMTFCLGGHREVISRMPVDWPDDPCTVAFPNVAIQITPRSMFTNGKVYQSWVFDIRRCVGRKSVVPQVRIEDTTAAILLGYSDASQSATPVFEFLPLGRRVLRGVRVTIDETNQPKRTFRFPWRRLRRGNTWQH